MPRKRTLKLRCPICKKAVKSGDPDFPFCSDRCRTIDLGKWASGAYVIPSPVTDADERFGRARPRIRTRNRERRCRGRGGVPPNSAVGDAHRHIFRDRTAAAWTRELGIGGNRVLVGGAGPRACAFAADAGCNRPSHGGHADRHSRGYTGRARLGNKRSAVCGDR